MAGDSVVKALSSWPCGCEFKPHQMQVCFHREKNLHITPPAYPAVNEDLALAGDGQDHWLCLNPLRSRWDLGCPHQGGGTGSAPASTLLGSKSLSSAGIEFPQVALLVAHYPFVLFCVLRAVFCYQRQAPSLPSLISGFLNQQCNLLTLFG